MMMMAAKTIEEVIKPTKTKTKIFHFASSATHTGVITNENQSRYN